MNNLLAVLKAGTAVVPPLKQDIVPDKRGIADLMQLAAKLSRQPQADPQTPHPTETRVAREKPQPVPASSGKQTLVDLGVERLQQLETMLGAVESRLTPVQKGELARLRDTLPADKSSSAPVTSSNNPLALTQDRLTPVQRGEQEREIIASRTPAPTKSGGASTSKAPVAFTGVEALNQRQTLGTVIDYGSIFGDGDVDGPLGFHPPIGYTPPGGETSPFRLPSDEQVAAAYEELNYKVQPGDLEGVFTPPINDHVHNNDIVDNILRYAKAGDPWGKALIDFDNKINSKTGLSSAVEASFIAVGFAQGVVQGVEAGKDALALSTAKLYLNAWRFDADRSILGYAGDDLRELPGVTGRLPAWLDELVPSNERVGETYRYTRQLGNNIGAYAITRALNPALAGQDLNTYFGKNWNNLKDAHSKAAAKGTVAEAEWWGQIIGRAGFEIASTAVAVKDIVTLGRAAAALAATGIAEGAAYSADKLSQISKAASDIIDFTKLATNDGTLGHATLDDMEALASSLDGAADLGPEHYGTTPEGRAAYNKIVEADDAVNRTVHKIKTPNAPYSEGNPDVYLSPNNQSWLNDLESTTKSIKYKNSSRIEFNSPVGPLQLKDLVRLTSHTGREFSLFKQGDTYVLIKGRARSIDIDPAFVQRMVNDKAAGKPWEWVAHSHSGYTFGNLYASAEDQNLLRRIGQEKSTIVNSRGHKAEFTQNDDQSVGPSHISVKKFTDAEAFYQATSVRNQILANTRYEFEGYYWETDSRGRTEYAGGLASREVAGREHGSLQTRIGKEGRKGDVGFHLIADRNNGPINYLNIVPANGKINNGAYKRFENAYNNILNSGTGRNEVRFNIRLKYDDGNLTNRPDDIILKYSSRQPAGLWSEGTPLNFNNRT